MINIIRVALATTFSMYVQVHEGGFHEPNIYIDPAVERYESDYTTAYRVNIGIEQTSPMLNYQREVYPAIIDCAQYMISMQAGWVNVNGELSTIDGTTMWSDKLVNSNIKSVFEAVCGS